MLRSSLVLPILFVLGSAWVPAARGADFVVTTQADTTAGGCDDPCSLRQAVEASNLSPGPDRILLPAGRHELEDDLEITEDVEILGAGMARSEIFHTSQLGVGLLVDPQETGVRASMRDLALTGVGLLNRADLDIQGLRIRNFGIRNFGELLMADSVVEDCIAVCEGGGILNLGNATIEGSTVRQNGVIQIRGCADGGGISNNGGTLLIRDSVIEENRASTGGGLYNLRGDMTVVDTVVRGNSVAENIQGTVGVGGGIFNDREGVMHLERVTVHDNFAGPEDQFYVPETAGIYNRHDLSMINVTVSSNRAAAVATEGPGLAGTTGALTNQGSLVLRNVTFSRNTAVDGPGALTLGGSVSIANTIIDGDCLLREDLALTDLGGNLESPGNGCGLEATTSQVDVPEARLAALAADQGTTPVHLPLPRSPAIDAGVEGVCPEFDQRGIARDDGSCDAGAIEFRAELDTPPSGVIPEEPAPPEMEARRSSSSGCSVQPAGSPGSIAGPEGLLLLFLSRFRRRDGDGIARHGCPPSSRGWRAG